MNTRTKNTNVLVVHNMYKERGGEDGSFQTNVQALKLLGFNVHQMTFHNDQLDGMSAASKFRATLWNAGSAKKVRDLCIAERIRVVHVHNTFPFASPSIYYAMRSAEAKVLQWIHNYRLLCPGASFFRDGKVCETCLHYRVPWPAAVHACYRRSHLASGAVVAMLATHRALGTWKKQVNRLISLTQFTRDKFVEAGFPADMIRVIPNHLHPDPGVGDGAGGYGLFAGRLTEEKGALLLLDALSRRTRRQKFYIAGDGVLASRVRSYVATDDSVEYLGPVPTARVLSLLKNAEYVVLPSIWYEGLPRNIIEAFAVGTPVIAPHLGPMKDLIRSGSDGLHYNAGDASSLALCMDQLAFNKDLQLGMRRQARDTYLAQFSFSAVRPRLLSVMQEMLSETGLTSND